MIPNPWSNTCQWCRQDLNDDTRDRDYPSLHAECRADFLADAADRDRDERNDAGLDDWLEAEHAD